MYSVTINYIHIYIHMYSFWETSVNRSTEGPLWTHLYHWIESLCFMRLVGTRPHFEVKSWTSESGRTPSSVPGDIARFQWSTRGWSPDSPWILDSLSLVFFNVVTDLTLSNWWWSLVTVGWDGWEGLPGTWKKCLEKTVLSDSLMTRCTISPSQTFVVTSFLLGRLIRILISLVT